MQSYMFVGGVFIGSGMTVRPNYWQTSLECIHSNFGDTFLGIVRQTHCLFDSKIVSCHYNTMEMFQSYDFCSRVTKLNAELSSISCVSETTILKDVHFVYMRALQLNLLIITVIVRHKLKIIKIYKCTNEWR